MAECVVPILQMKLAKMRPSSGEHEIDIDNNKIWNKLVFLLAGSG
jgi:hypothetical protein